ncbi:hypothetical protein DPMN_163745 [Dreissena polymorpha]|uniref:Uncharacterized protein n=1 Tax=Dreissena polymorpha TaxID=45954 RepID=A0A9D4EWD9_DREPO|nr:hypothetical protein DPMN_163745 [Dreissena polymorpha]
MQFLHRKMNSVRSHNCGSSKVRNSRVNLHECGFWSWIFLLLQLQMVKLWYCMYFVYRGLFRIRKYRRYRITRLRFRKHSDHRGQSKKYMLVFLTYTFLTGPCGTTLSDSNYGMLNIDRNPRISEVSSAVGSLAKLSRVYCSLERTAKLQQQVPGIGVVVKWRTSDSQTPPKDTVSDCLACNGHIQFYDKLVYRKRSKHRKHLWDETVNNHNHRKRGQRSTPFRKMAVKLIKWSSINGLLFTFPSSSTFTLQVRSGICQHVTPKSTS